MTVILPMGAIEGTERSFTLHTVNRKIRRKIAFDFDHGDGMHRFEIAIRSLEYLRTAIVNTALDEPFKVEIVPPDMRVHHRVANLSNKYQNPLNDPYFGTLIELATDEDDEIDIPF